MKFKEGDWLNSKLWRAVIIKVDEKDERYYGYWMLKPNQWHEFGTGFGWLTKRDCERHYEQI
tara:strand:- start:5017 stop:5202 length:186 start_codon:yes stop_codon:yes gene_type:complete